MFVVVQMERAEGTTERRRTLECEKTDSEELQLKYKVRGHLILLFILSPLLRGVDV